MRHPSADVILEIMALFSIAIYLPTMYIGKTIAEHQKNEKDKYINK